jgi:hypothetical protein
MLEGSRNNLESKRGDDSAGSRLYSSHEVRVFRRDERAPNRPSKSQSLSNSRV